MLHIAVGDIIAQKHNTETTFNESWKTLLKYLKTSGVAVNEMNDEWRTPFSLAYIAWDASTPNPVGYFLENELGAIHLIILVLLLFVHVRKICIGHSVALHVNAKKSTNVPSTC